MRPLHMPVRVPFLSAVLEVLKMQEQQVRHLPALLMCSPPLSFPLSSCGTVGKDPAPHLPCETATAGFSSTHAHGVATIRMPPGPFQVHPSCHAPCSLTLPQVVYLGAPVLLGGMGGPQWWGSVWNATHPDNAEIAHKATVGGSGRAWGWGLLVVALGTWWAAKGRWGIHMVLLGWG